MTGLFAAYYNEQRTHSPGSYRSSLPIPIPLSTSSTETYPAIERGRLPSRTRNYDVEAPQSQLATPTSSTATEPIYHRSPSAGSSSASELERSAILSPAAEFLGFFSSSAQSTRARSGTNFSQYLLSSDRGSANAANAHTKQPSQSPSSAWSRSFIVPDPDEDGEIVNGYILEKTIGQGTFSTVKQAIDTETGELVAVKIVRHSTIQSNSRGSTNPEPRSIMSASLISTVSNPGMRQGSAPLTRPLTQRHRSSSSPVINLQSALGNARYKKSDEFAVEGLPASSSGGLSIELYDSNYSPPVSPASFPHPVPEDNEDGKDSDTSRAHSAIQKEILIWSQLQIHPHIMPLLDFYESDFASFIFMPLCSGNLLQYVKEYGRGGPKSPEQFVTSSNFPSAALTFGSSPRAQRADTSRSPPESSSSTSGVGRSVSISSNSSTSNKPHRSSSIRLRHPGEVAKGGAGLSPDRIRPIFAQIVSGLRYLHHDAKITHKDIKLENILLDRDGSTFRISDFGSAHSAAAHDRHEASNPRHWRAKMDPKSKRGHALSHGDAQMMITGITASAANSTGWSSLGEAATLLEASLDSSTPTGHMPSPPYFSLSSSTPSDDSRPSLSTRRSQKHAVPASLSHMPPSFGHENAGSLQYTSPEQIRSPAPLTDTSVDIWALGCVLYAMIDGTLPFDDGFEPRLRVNIIKGKWKLPSALTSHSASNRTADRAAEGEPSLHDQVEKVQIETVLRGCLEVDPLKRWTVEQIAQSEWLREAIHDTAVPTSPLRGRKREAELIVRTESRSSSRGRLHSAARDAAQPRSASSISPVRRGPSLDDYRKVRGGMPSSPGRSSRSRSSQRRNSGNSWVIL